MKSDQQIADAQLKQAQQQFEAMFTDRPVDGNRYRAPTGELYVQICGTTSVKPFGFVDSADAVDSWLTAVRAYAAKKGAGTLYWRIEPEINSGHKGPPNWRVYSRLLISDKPVLAAPNLLLSDQWRDHVNAVTLDTE